MRKTPFLISALCVCVVFLVSACSGVTNAPAKTTEPSSAGIAKQPTPVPTKERVKVTMAVGGDRQSLIFLVPIFAKYSNYFEEENIDLDLQELKGGAQAAQALVSGQVDFASMAVEHAIKSKAQGVDLVMINLYTRYPTVTLVVDSKLKDKVKSIQDLKGMKIGITSPGSGSHKALLSLLDKFGVKPTEVEIVGVGTSSMPAALEAGQIQAAANYDPYITQVTSTGKAFVLWDLRNQKGTEALYGGEYPYVSLVTRRDVLEKNPGLVDRMVRASVRANKFLTSNTPEAIASRLPVEIKGTNDDLYRASLQANLEAFSPDGIATEKGLQIVIDSLKKDKVIPDNSDIKPASVFDGSYLRKSN